MMDAVNYKAPINSKNSDAIGQSNLLIDDDLVSQLLEPVNSLPFCPRTRHLLEKYGIKTVADLSDFHNNSHIYFRGIGKTTSKEIREGTEKYYRQLINKYPVENIILALKRIQISSNPEPPFREKNQETSGSTLNSSTIESLPLPLRVIRTLLRNGIMTKEDLINTSEDIFLNIKNIGPKSIQEIMRVRKEYLRDSRCNSQKQKDQFFPLVVNQLDIPHTTKGKLTTLDINSLDDLSQYSEEDLFIKANLTFIEITVINNYLNSNGASLRKCWPTQSLVHESDFKYLERLGVPFNKIDISRLALPINLEGILKQRLHILTLSSLLSQSMIILQAALLFNNNSSLRLIEKNTKLYFDWLPTQPNWIKEVTKSTPSPVLFYQLKETSLANIIEYILAALPKEKHRMIIGLRYGVDREKRFTLKEIAEIYHISRERVRQIETHIISKLLRISNENLIQAIYFLIHEEMEKRGGLMSIDQIATFLENHMELGEIQFGGAISLLLSLEDGIFLELEPGKLWGLKGGQFNLIISIRRELLNILKNHFAPLTYFELVDHLKKSQWYSNLTNQDLLSDELIRACISTDDRFEETGNDLWMLSKWKNSRVDDIVMALRKLGKPSHFSEITRIANETLPPMQHLSARNCHAILGRKTDLFVWAGRGTYGLSDWGISRVRFYVDIAEEYLELRKEPLSIEEIFSQINSERGASLENISFMLGTNHRFSRYPSNKYGLARWIEDESDDVDNNGESIVIDPFLDDLKKRFFDDFHTDK